RADLSVADPIMAFAEESLERHGIDATAFWAGVSEIVHDLAPRNAALLRIREMLQSQLDDYHRANPGRPDPAEYRDFLTEIGYLEAEPRNVEVTTSGVAPEIASLAGPQLVVPILNARFALNAANARWGSLYDALYGTDAIPTDGDLAPGSAYNEARGAAVIARGRELLDTIAPLRGASHADAVGYAVRGASLTVALRDGSEAELSDPAAFAGYTGEAEDPSAILLAHNGLHLEIAIDRAGAIGANDAAGIQD